MTTHRILVVDDEQDMAHSLRRLLRLKGYEVEVARLGDTTGLDVLRHLKERNSTAIVIEMTGCTAMEDPLQQGLEMTATACFTKPIDIERMLSTINDAVRTQETRLP